MGTLYKVTITHVRTQQSRLFEWYLNFLPSDIIKAKNFALSLNGVLEGNAICTDIKYSIYQADKPQLFTENYTTKIMYKTTKKGIFNCSIPYLDTNFNKTVLKGFMSQYFEDFLDIDNVLVKREI
ncbi:MAG: hypothetical protein NTX05_06035 [Fusobacteria bacterium]|nr:hypothetical protein [Fusobacteriota bacterium]